MPYKCIIMFKLSNKIRITSVKNVKYVFELLYRTYIIKLDIDYKERTRIIKLILFYLTEF